MKTPQEKAEELIYAYSTAVLIDSYEAKLCALIAVDEILKEVVLTTMYWQQVKQEIEKL